MVYRTGNMELTEMQELQRLEERTNPDGTIMVELVDFYKGGDGKAKISAIDANGNEKTYSYEWPVRATEDYKIVRIANRYCGGLAGLDDLKELPVNATVEILEDGGHKVIAPPVKTSSDRVMDVVKFTTSLTPTTWRPWSNTTTSRKSPSCRALLYMVWILIALSIIIIIILASP